MEVDEKPKPTIQSCITKQVYQENSTKPSQPFNSCFGDALATAEVPESSTKPPQPFNSCFSDTLATAEVPESSTKPSQPFKKDDSSEDVENIENIEDDKYLDSFPPGYRFCPSDEELIIHYLKKKVLNEPLPHNRIAEVNLYRYNPQILAEQYKQYGEKEWYFFTPRDKKYRNGTRPNRAAGDGYWKATGADREVKFNNHVVGYRKALVFYRGKPPKGDKTNWIMHEYRVNDPPPCNTAYNDMRLDDWVLCRIYKKVDKPVGNRVKDNSRSQLMIQNEDTKVMDYDADLIYCLNNSYMHQSFSDESFINYQNIVENQFSTSFIPGQEIWRTENFYTGVVEPSIIVDNTLPDDTPNKDSDSANS